MLNDPMFHKPAIDEWLPVVSVDDDGRFIRLDLESRLVAQRMQAGQFLQIAPHVRPAFQTGLCETGWHYPLLNRPFSIHRWLHHRTGISILLDRVGPGTKVIAAAKPGDRIRCIGPLGHGMEEVPAGKTRFIFVAGGIGVAPFDAFAELANRTGIVSSMAYGVGRIEDLTFRLGNRTRLADEMERFGCPTYLASMTGEVGFHGTVVDLIDHHHQCATGCFAQVSEPETVLLIGCGPWPMLKALAQWADARHLDCMVLLEEMMGCGFGVCRSCILPGWTSSDPVKRRPCNITTCRQGPLLDARRVDWDGSIA